MHVSYCEKWFLPKRRAIRPISEEEASARHAARQPYCALIGGESKPTIVVSVAGQWVSVSFLDDLGREYLRYDLKEHPPSDLFLTMAIYRDFEGDTDEVAVATQFAFKEDGSVLMERRQLPTNAVQERRWRGDISSNWERYPSFGKYDALCRVERDLSRA
jgi:hypothetical protein